MDFHRPYVFLGFFLKKGGKKFNLKWNYTNKLVNDLLKINRAKEVVDLLEIPVSIEEEIKKETTAKRVHYFTKIDGNSLKLDEVIDALENNNESHERNVLEARKSLREKEINDLYAKIVFTIYGSM